MNASRGVLCASVGTDVRCYQSDPIPCFVKIGFCLSKWASPCHCAGLVILGQKWWLLNLSCSFQTRWGLVT